MELGFHIPIFDVDGGPTAVAGELARVGSAAEESGATWLSFMDHFFQIEPTGLPAEASMLEGYTTLGYLAAHTSTIDLGLLVTGVTYRHPGLLAQIVTTLDVLSGGRAVLGIGAAWYEREHQGLGVPFPPLRERFERLEEALQICAQMWDPKDDGPFEGTHYQLAETLCSPQPLHRPRVLIGGGAIVTESLFNIEGVGLFTAEALETQDFPSIMAVTIFGAFFIVLFNILVDIAYAYLDPRIRIGTSAV